MIENNLRLVAHIVKKYVPVEWENEDLLSVGTIGLIKAVDSYQSSRGSKLSTYAAKCIENEILMTLRGEKKRRREVSLFDPIGTDKEGNEIRLVDVIEGDDRDLPAELDRNDLLCRLKPILNRVLDEREQKIIAMRYGLAENREMTQREVAERLGISRSYISRIEKKALLKMKDMMTVD